MAQPHGRLGPNVAGNSMSKVRARRILAVASGGGHWHQLMLISEAFSDRNVIFATTIPGLAEASGVAGAYILPDCNRSEPAAVLACVREIARLVFKTRPDVVVTTGAAPGILAVVFGRLLGAKTIWIDSVANAEKISMSGRMASWLANVCLTQWEHLEGGRIRFAGRLL